MNERRQDHCRGDKNGDPARSQTAPSSAAVPSSRAAPPTGRFRRRSRPAANCRAAAPARTAPGPDRQPVARLDVGGDRDGEVAVAGPEDLRRAEAVTPGRVVDRPAVQVDQAQRPVARRRHARTDLDRRSARRAARPSSSTRAISCSPSPTASGISPLRSRVGPRIGIGLGRAGVGLDLPRTDPHAIERTGRRERVRAREEAEAETNDADQQDS